MTENAKTYPQNLSLNIHMLKSHSASCLNRDESGMPKDLHFGGTRRLRISSQCLKYAMRNDAEFEKLFGGSALRTGHLYGLIRYILSTDKYRNTDPRVVCYAVNAGMKDKTTTAWTMDEVDSIISVIEKYAAEDAKGYGVFPNFNPDFLDEEKDEDNKKTKHTPIKELDKLLVKELEKVPSMPMDVCIGGRMCAESIFGDVEAAVSVAHAFTTHAFDNDIDSFIAHDDLREKGASHLGELEFGSGVFYSYMNVNLGVLAKNMGCPGDIGKALGAVSELLSVISRANPGGKQTNFASFPYADYMMLTLSDSQPLSLANAFEKPVRSSEGYMDQSIAELEKYWNKLSIAYDVKDSVAVFTTRESSLGETAQECKTMKELSNWVKG